MNEEAWLKCMKGNVSTFVFVIHLQMIGYQSRSPLTLFHKVIHVNTTPPSVYKVNHVNIPEVFNLPSPSPSPFLNLPSPPHPPKSTPRFPLLPTLHDESMIEQIKTHKRLMIGQVLYGFPLTRSSSPHFTLHHPTSDNQHKHLLTFASNWKSFGR